MGSRPWGLKESGTAEQLIHTLLPRVLLTHPVPATGFGDKVGISQVPCSPFCKINFTVSGSYIKIFYILLFGGKRWKVCIPLLKVNELPSREAWHSMNWNREKGPQNLH